MSKACCLAAIAYESPLLYIFPFPPSLALVLKQNFIIMLFSNSETSEFLRKTRAVYMNILKVQESTDQIMYLEL